MSDVPIPALALAPTGPPRPAALAMRGITKTFPGVHALRGVDLDVAAGEVLALVGENGAGKSTLIKILSGAYARDAGTIELRGVPVGHADPHAMIERGVAVIYQEPSLARHLTVAENVFMGRLPRQRGIVDHARLVRDTGALLARLELDVDPRVRVGRLNVARRQMVEIARALSRDAGLVVLDEPSAVLGDAELDGLFAVVRRLARDGVGVIYISHRLNEVFRIADRVTVLKDGAVVGSAPTDQLDPETLIRMMVGRDMGDLYPLRPPPTEEVVLEVSGLARRGVLQDIGFSVRAGEILGIAGLAGSGRTEIRRAIHGADPIDRGQIAVHGTPVSIDGPTDAIRAGIGLLTEDRKADGLLLLQSVAVNTTIARLSRVSSGGILRLDRERSVARRYIERLGIRTPGPGHRVRVLSGGNQQKVILAKWLHAECRVLLIDEPTRGVDVGAKREIYRLLADLAARGVAIVMVSSELPEVLGLSDRVLVMREGRIAAVLDRGAATEEAIMRAATRHAA
jgi:ribose transport system ATP-binding protein